MQISCSYSHQFPPFSDLITKFNLDNQTDISFIKIIKLIITNSYILRRISFVNQKSILVKKISRNSIEKYKRIV